MSNILCLYYSRTGKTKAAMEQLAELLDAELAEVSDGKARAGAVGFLASGLDAMKKTPEKLLPLHTRQALGEYDHVILATPVWAGRCSSITRSFLIEYGAQLPEHVSYVITHMGDAPYTQVFDQMDRYLAAPHELGLSLQPAAADYHQKIYDFVRALRGEAAESAQ